VTESRNGARREDGANLKEGAAIFFGKERSSLRKHRQEKTAPPISGLGMSGT